MIGDSAWRFRRRFEAAARQAPAGPLATYYAAGFPDFRTDCASLAMTAMDLETDGLDPARHPILEIGAVGMNCRSITLATAQRLRIRPDRALRQETVIIHRITDDALAAEGTEAEALARILPALAGKVLVAHFASIEAAFLDAACRRAFGASFVAPFICTMQLESRWFPEHRKPDGLRLGPLRARYGLPDYRAHDGLIDAIACGELFLAQMARRIPAPARLSDLISR